jgi:hypothetical protein
MHRKEENLTENRTLPMLSEIYIKSTNEETSSLSLISFCRKTKTKVED